MLPHFWRVLAVVPRGPCSMDMYYPYDRLSDVRVSTLKDDLEAGRWGADYLNSALNVAASYGFTSSVVYLCGLPPRFGRTTRATQDALGEAVLNGHLGVVKVLCGLQDDSVSAAPCFDAAVQAGHAHVVEFFCSLPPEHGVDAGARNTSALKRAARDGFVGVVRALCLHGADVAVDNNYPVRWAARCGHTPVVRWLCELPVDRGVDVSADTNFAVRCAAQNGHVEVVKYLLSLPACRGVDVCAEHHYALRWAATNGHEEMIQLLCSLPQHCGVMSRIPLLRSVAEAMFLGHAGVVCALCTVPGHRGIDASDILAVCTEFASYDCVHDARRAIQWRRTFMLFALSALRRQDRACFPVHKMKMYTSYARMSASPRMRALS